MKKTYYQCKLTQSAPLRVGTGAGDETDSDVMTDSRGLPFIPGTSIAGVLRTYLTETDADRLFGHMQINRNAPRMQESKTLVSDATLPGRTKEGRDFRIVPRHGVGLTDNGTAKAGALFDFETVECKLPYVTVLELADDVNDSEKLALEAALQRAVDQGISFGARTTRGYGKMQAEVTKREFDFPAQLSEWLTFNAFEEDRFGGELLVSSKMAQSDQLEIMAELAFEGSFSVREYTTRLAKTREKVAPDYSPLTSIDDKPVIHGTSWAGCFRHHMKTFVYDSIRNDEERAQLLKEIDELFGKTEDKKKRSEILFSETSVDGGKEYTVTRIAVDRFTSAPRNQGLYSSSVAWGGSGSLRIELPADTSPVLLRLLAAALIDLDIGLLAIGGEGGVGRGLCKIARLTVNGAEQTQSIKAHRVDFLETGGIRHGQME